MRRSTAAIFLSGLICACSARGGEEPRVFKKSSDRVYVALGLAQLFGHPCYERVGGVLGPGAMEDCYRFLPPQRMRGVWKDEFEGSEFFPGATLPPAEGTETGIWLDVETHYSTLPHILRQVPGEKTRYLKIDFIGRRTQFPGSYGHTGASTHFVIVKRVLTVTPAPRGSSRRARLKTPAVQRAAIVSAG